MNVLSSPKRLRQRRDANTWERTRKLMMVRRRRGPMKRPPGKKQRNSRAMQFSIGQVNLSIWINTRNTLEVKRKYSTREFRHQNSSLVELQTRLRTAWKEPFHALLLWKRIDWDGKSLAGLTQHKGTRLEEKKTVRDNSRKNVCHRPLLLFSITALIANFLTLWLAPPDA